MLSCSAPLSFGFSNIISVGSLIINGFLGEPICAVFESCGDSTEVFSDLGILLDDNFAIG